MLNIIYIKNKNKKKSIYNNSINFPILLNKYNKIHLFIYIKYIKSININLFKSNLNYNESYTLNKRTIKSFHLTNTYFPKIYIQDTLYNKNILIKHTFPELNYIFTNNYIICKNMLSQLTHRQCFSYNNSFFNNSKCINSNVLNTLKLNKEYILLTTYYSYWKNLFTNNYNINLFSGFSFKENKSYYPISPIKDITSGLISIETIFEARALPNKYLIPIKLSILTNIYMSYEDTSLNYIWKYSLYMFNVKNVLLFTDINTFPIKIIENKTAILLPNNIITSGNYSINTLTLKLFLHNLNYYTQEDSIKLSHIFMFNLIVESLLKQYFKNGIIIPSIQFELIIKKMTSFVKINYIGDSSLVENDILDFSKLETLNYTLYILGFKISLCIPIILGITKSILASSGFLASISFQEIIKYLIKLSMGHSTDWLTDLKSKIITTDLITTGSGWYRHFIKI